MIQADIGYDTDFWLDDIAAIKSTAHANFDDGHINLHISEIAKGQSRGHLKKGQ